MTRTTLTMLALAGLSAAVVSTALPGISLADTGPGAGLMLQRFDQMDADKDGKVTEAELQAFRVARFAAADADKNGSLSAEELLAHRESEMADIKAARAAKMMQRIDVNSDGQVSAEEFAAAGSARSPFQRADTDGDGALSKAEAEAMVQKMADRGGKHGKRGHGGEHGGWWGWDAN